MINPDADAAIRKRAKGLTDAAPRRGTTILGEDGLTELHVAEIDDWATLPVHPEADKLPMMSDAELEALAADIKANGLLEPIVVWEDNTEAAQGGEGPFPTYLLDGRNRLAALKLLGITDPHDAPKGKGENSMSGWAVKTLKALVSTVSGGASTPTWLPGVNPVTYVLSRNVHRRHLTSRQKRNVIAAYLVADPMASDRTVAKALGVSDKTVGKVRADLQGRAEIPHVSTRTDSAGRKQPATKRKHPAPKPKPTPKPEATAKPEPIDEDTVAEQPIAIEPPGGLTQNSPGQTDRVKRALENAKDAIEPASEDTEFEPAQNDPETRTVFAASLDGIAASLDVLAVYAESLDTDALLAVVQEHADAMNDVVKTMDRILRALSAAETKARAGTTERGNRSTMPTGHDGGDRP